MTDDTDDRFLVDTSVWIEALRRDGRPEFRVWLRAALVEDKIFMAPPVKAELLSGSVNEKQFDELIKDLEAIPLLRRHDEVWEYTARLNFALRRRGINVPLMDALIASWAVVHKCTLVHHDRHYEMIKKADTNLQTMYILNLPT